MDCNGINFLRVVLKRHSACTQFNGGQNQRPPFPIMGTNFLFKGRILANVLLSYVGDYTSTDSLQHHNETLFTIIVMIFHMKNCGRRDTVTAAENIGCLDFWLLFAFTLELVHVVTSFASFHSCSALNALMLTALGSSSSETSLSAELSSSLTNVTVRNCKMQS